jgi:hypothetical protein
MGRWAWPDGSVVFGTNGEGPNCAFESGVGAAGTSGGAPTPGTRRTLRGAGLWGSGLYSDVLSACLGRARVLFGG